MIFLIVYSRIGHACRSGTLTDPVAPDNEITHHFGCVISLSWLGQLDSNQY
ncbi:MAG: hypothetical protein J6Y49_02550 [Alphaproteobacteria bacterium]|nr:hypothetical protein [Alphaproteobacteria bacterium]